MDFNYQWTQPNDSIQITLLHAEASLTTASADIAMIVQLASAYTKIGFSQITPAILNRSAWNFTVWWGSDRTVLIGARTIRPITNSCANYSAEYEYKYE